MKIDKILIEKKNKLNWNTFNFIENLLVYCPLIKRHVPVESGRSFQISSKINQNDICIVYIIDREALKLDTLIDKNDKRPDYLVLYVNTDNCFCTIVEMKGKTKNELVRGVKQIASLKEIISREIRKCLPNKIKIIFQAILLSAYGSDIPRKLISDIAQRGITILPIQYSNRAELRLFVSKALKLTDKYEHEHIRFFDDSQNIIEYLLVHRAMHKRINHILYREFSSDKNNSLYLFFVNKDNKTLSTLYTTNTNSIIFSDSEDVINRVKNDLNLLNLKNNFDFRNQ